VAANSRSTRLRVAVWFALALAIAATSTAAQATFGVTEIADYRLRAEVFERFGRASRLIAAITRTEARFEREPLFTEEVLLSGDVLPMAVALEARLRGDPALAGAVRDANLTPQEYTKFTLALVAARLAHGFVKSGAIRAVPPGVHADNVAFVDAHLPEVQAVLRELGVD
jgi:hypothetical protein